MMNLTSQWFGSIHLTAFDHWVQEKLRCWAYGGYVDDFLLFSNGKAELADWRTAIQVELRRHLRGEMTKDAIRCRWMSWGGHALQADTEALVTNIRNEFIAMLVGGDRSVSNRVLRGGS